MVIGDSHSVVGSVGSRYASVSGGSNSIARSVDVSQYAAAVYMIDVATRNMDQQFAQYLTVFSDLA